MTKTEETTVMKLSSRMVMRVADVFIVVVFFWAPLHWAFATPGWAQYAVSLLAFFVLRAVGSADAAAVGTGLRRW